MQLITDFDRLATTSLFFVATHHQRTVLSGRLETERVALPRLLSSIFYPAATQQQLRTSIYYTVVGASENWKHKEYVYTWARRLEDIMRWCGYIWRTITDVPARETSICVKEDEIQPLSRALSHQLGYRNLDTRRDVWTLARDFSGGSSRVFGSQMLGGSTINSSRNSSMPSTMSWTLTAQYATSQNTCNSSNSNG